MQDLGFGISVIHWLTFQSFLVSKNGNETDVLETVNEKEEYKNWLKPCIDKKVVFYRKCRKTIELSNMWEQALKCYMKGKKHITNSKPICFFQTKPIPVVQAVETGTGGHLSGSSGKPLPASTNQKQMTLRFNSADFVVDRWKTEIMWALKCVVCDWSINSAEEISDLFKVMFSDSLITSEYRMSHTRLSYLINFGIAPHFHQLLVD